ncbi:poly(A)-specific ribonuclease PARN [Novymonas esmeraldas]|uniref:Poly(A)-specific ribonuclease PARN n=1 Tax=Novymonas esmeraldas TaxID=1808958 RepID=A0AAW0ET13_9TRYP
MEITNDNAEELLPHIRRLLHDCAFVSVDLEFTGIDHDRAGADGDSESAEAMMSSLTRKPEDLYPFKLEVNMRYSVTQIGIAIFTEKKSPPADAAAAPESALRSAVSEFVDPAAVDSAYCLATTVAVENILAGSATDTSGAIAASNYVLQLLSKVTQSLDVAAPAVGRRAAKGKQSSSQPEESISILRHRHRFLEALDRAVMTGSCAHAAPAAGAAAGPPAANYEVHTFSAYLFPAAIDATTDVRLNIETAEFLVNNAMDLTRWVKEGLRFLPFQQETARLVDDVESRLQNTARMMEPHVALPGYQKRIGAKLNELLPLSAGELQLVNFVLSLPDPADGDAVAARVTPFYVGALRRLISVSRGLVAESTLPEPIYIKDAMYKEEMDALAAIGIGKANRKYFRTRAAGGGGHNATSGARRAAKCYGNALMETLLHATELEKKPIVFFNGYTDLMFMLLLLYGAADMPPDLPSFKSVVHHHFPSIFDTRVLCCAGPLQPLGNFTGRLAAAVEEMSKVTPAATRVSFTFDSLVAGGADATKTLAVHNAAFDALLTGKLFVMAKAVIADAGGSLAQFENYLASYNTLMSIDLTHREDRVVGDTHSAVYFLPDGTGLRIEAIRAALAASGITATVMYRGSGYTLHSVRPLCGRAEWKALAMETLSAKAHAAVVLYDVDS